MRKLSTINTTSLYDTNEHTRTTTIYAFENWDEQIAFEEMSKSEQQAKLEGLGHYTTRGFFVGAGARTRDFRWVQDEDLLIVSDIHGYNI